METNHKIMSGEKLDSMRNVAISILVILVLHTMTFQKASAQQPDFSLTIQEAQPIYAILFDIFDIIK